MYLDEADMCFRNPIQLKIHLCKKDDTYVTPCLERKISCEIVNPAPLSLVDTTGRSPLLHATNSPFHGSTVSGDSGAGLSHPASPLKGKHNSAVMIGSPAASGRRRQISSEHEQV